MASIYRGMLFILAILLFQINVQSDKVFPTSQNLCKLDEAWKILKGSFKPEKRVDLLSLPNSEICHIAFASILPECYFDYFIYSNLQKISRSSLKKDDNLDGFLKNVCQGLEFGVCDQTKRKNLIDSFEIDSKNIIPVNSYELFNPTCSKHSITAGLSDKISEPLNVLGTFYSKNSDTIICQDCKKLIEDFKQLLQNDKTEESISKMFIQNICSQLPNTFKEFCTSFIKEQVKSIIKIINTSIDDKEACEALYLCDGVSKSQYSYLAKDNQEILLCGSCLSFMKSNGIFLIEDTTFDESTKKFYRAFSKKLTLFFDNVYLKDKSPIEKCQIIQACPENQQFEVQVKIPMGKKQFCDPCKENIAKIINGIGEVEDVCGKFPSKLKTLCQEIIYPLSDKIEALISLGYKEETICQSFGQCSISEEMQNHKDFVTVNNIFNHLLRAYSPNNVTCDLCQSFLNDARWNMRFDLKREEVSEEVANLACSSMIDPMIKSICKSFVDNQFALIHDQLVKTNFNRNDKEICINMNFCPKDFGKYEIDLIEKLLDERHKGLSAVGCSNNSPKHSAFNPPLGFKDRIFMSTEKIINCDQCKDVMSLMKKGSHYKEFMIKDAFVKEICQKVPSTFDICTEEIFEKWPIIRSSLIKYDEELFCKMANVCSKNDVMRGLIGKRTLFDLVDDAIKSKEVETGIRNSFIQTHPKVKRIKSDDYCTFCQMVIKYFYDNFDTKSNREKIKEDLEKTCNLMPTFFQKGCDEFVVKYSDLLIDGLEQNFPPHVVCFNIKLCDKSTPALIHDEIVCHECEVIFRYIYSQLKKDSTEKEVAKYLENVCYLIPKYEKECLKIVDNYTQTLIRLLIAETSPHDICRAINFCPILNLCPEYDLNFVCSSTFHAKICNKSKECTSKKFRKHFLTGFTQQADACSVSHSEKICNDERLLDMCNFEKECAQYFYRKWLTFVSDLTNQKETCLKCNELLTQAKEMKKLFPKSNAKLLNCDLFKSKREDELLCQSVSRLLQVETTIDLNSSAERKRICLNLDHCKSDERNGMTNLKEECLQGPEKWCSSVENALKCGYHIYLSCLENSWNSKPSEEGECKAGPIHYCQNISKAVHCKGLHKCWNLPRKLEGECKKGPQYWCQSFSNALQCQGVSYCYSINHKIIPEDKKDFNCTGLSQEVVCRDENFSRACQMKEVCDRRKEICLSGPALFCKDEESAKFCKMHSWCKIKGYFNHKEVYVPSFRKGVSASKTEILPSECFWGSLHWCKDKAIAKKCGPAAEAICNSKALKGKYANFDCAKGANYWCMNLENAKACNAIDYCLDSGLLSIDKHREILEKCARSGVTYWCRNRVNAEKCKKTEFCEKVIWKDTSMIYK